MKRKESGFPSENLEAFGGSTTRKAHRRQRDPAFVGADIASPGQGTAAGWRTASLSADRSQLMGRQPAGLSEAPAGCSRPAALIPEILEKGCFRNLSLRLFFS